MSAHGAKPAIQARAVAGIEGAMVTVATTRRASTFQKIRTPTNR